jgi:tRNA(adenine34) deaminase
MPINKSAKIDGYTFQPVRHAAKGLRWRPGGGTKLRQPMVTIGNEDREFMEAALGEARAAGARGEVPVGAVVVVEGRIVARAGNRTIADCDPTAHAEMVALREAAAAIGNYRLGNATMYVTIEPCAMCAGAMIQARVSRLVYGADDPKAGAVRSCFSVLDHPKLNHRVEMKAGVMQEESAALLREFFAARR